MLKLPSRPRILLTNDDGIYAPGLKVLEEIAASLSDDIWVAAPLTEQSGAGHSLTLRNPLRIRTLAPKRFAIEGTPTDCVLLALNNLMEDARPHLILSGVNNGANLGEDVTYSGTIAAAMEATLLGVPAIALSQVIQDRLQPTRWEVAQRWGPKVLEALKNFSWQADVFLSVNFPDCPVSDIRGVQATVQGRRKVAEELTKRLDPRGQPYYWIGPMVHHAPSHADSDLAAIDHNLISVTPLHLDLTHHETKPRLEAALKEI